MIKKILFVCVENAGRSQMGEAFLRKYAGDNFEVYSAGFASRPIHPYTIQVMNELGFDLSGQHRRT
jgi:arsenate reductase (thioredoxin)